MEGRTQLIIDGVEVVLPDNFATTVKRENSFFTKNGEYTYDCTLRLDNDVNRRLYGFLHRLNKTEAVDSRRSAELVADGKVFCRGTEVITGWTDKEVQVQIVSGNSELNYFIGDSLKIEWLDMGEITEFNTFNLPYPTFDYCLPLMRSGGHVYNDLTSVGQQTGDALIGSLVRPQPYLLAILNRLISALGYEVNVNDLTSTPFYNLFIVNTVRTVEFAKMLPGWTVRDFLVAVEDLCGVVFITDNLTKKVDILQKSTYYANARQYPLANVVDEYELNISEDSDAEFTNSRVEFDIPDHQHAKFMRLPEGLLSAMPIKDFDSIVELVADTDNEGKILRDTSTGRLYIRKTETFTYTAGSFGNPSTQNEVTSPCYLEIDQFKDLDRENADSTLSLKITPAPLAPIGGRACNCEVIDLSTEDASDSTSPSEEEDETDIETSIRNYEKTESSASDLYCAFFSANFFVDGSFYNIPLVYTDAYHGMLQTTLYPWLANFEITGSALNGSLRLQDIDADLYAGVYRVDTSRQVTFETYDPNLADPRGVFVIRNKRFVCREIEESITAKGRKPRWKMTCHPIELSDEATEQRWVLTRGVWEDGGAWLDDGRWND